MFLPALSPSASSVASSHTPASTSYPKQRKATHSKATLFLITLTLACCLLATSSSNCLAAPIASKSLRQQQQRSLAYQVHHVQVADESVHNNVVLLKKSIQKRRSQNNKRQQQPQQQQKRGEHQGHETEVKKTKRHGKREFVDSFHVPVPENHDDKNNRVQHADSSLNNNDANVGDASALSIVDSIATTAADARSSSTSSEPHDNAIFQPINKNQQKQSQKKKHRATRLLSAYESIVFSESQIPVFLTQDRHHHNNKHTNDKQRKQRQQRPILRAQNQGYIRIRKGTAASQELDDAMIERNNNAERHQNPITADTTSAKASSSSSPPSTPVDDDVAVVQVDDMHHLLSSSSSFSASASIVLDSGLEHSVAQDAAASNNNNLQSDHVDDRGDDKGVTTTTKDDKNSSFLLDNSHASTVASVVVQVEQQEDFEESFPIVDIAVMDENGDTSSATPGLEAVVVLEINVGEEGAINPPSAGEEVVVAVMEDKAVVQVESTRSGNEDEEEDGWVTITDADLVGSSSESDNIISSNDSSLASNVVEFQSPESDDVDSIPLSVGDSSNNGPIPQEQQHQQHTAPTAAATKRLFHNGCSSSSTVVSLGLLLTAIGLAYRFYIRKQQQEQSLRLALPFNDVKIAPHSSSSTSSSSSSKSVHRLSVDSLPSPTMRESGARTTAMRDYVGFNIQ
ncbi:MAG: hypothetical protein J3R72DRAFT_446491 [Linnemannia gamsii]|nr:MAG: hypothetical protein J3R72DRAFT_446491 [Linnemannia gamsii]